MTRTSAQFRLGLKQPDLGLKQFRLGLKQPDLGLKQPIRN
jgi:hypothetical protein